MNREQRELLAIMAASDTKHDTDWLSISGVSGERFAPEQHYGLHLNHLRSELKSCRLSLQLANAEVKRLKRELRLARREMRIAGHQTAAPPAGMEEP